LVKRPSYRDTIRMSQNGSFVQQAAEPARWRVSDIVGWPQHGS
jgi:hypothetical protein